jgi:hypothetical protein
MKLKTKEQGVVLVITLIMLSVVTLMAIVFLGVSRRERATVTVTTDHITAKFAAEAGMARAQSEVVGRILSSSNRFDFDYTVSTNFFDPDGYDTSNFNFDPHNVNYFLPNGDPINDPYNQAVNIGNQFYDPRPPVFIENIEYNPRLRQYVRDIDFRFYLDFNRNGRFDPTGLLPDFNENNRQLLDSESGLPVWTRNVGDPQWIGILEDPGMPHSAINRFIGRFAYIMIPEGRTLDLNTIHNQIKGDSNNQDYFVRNQGIGPWEINLGAFLRDLNPRIWTGYQYAGPLNGAENTGNSFRDAFSILNYRRANRTLTSLNALANPSPLQMQQDFVDLFANGPYLLNKPWLEQDLADNSGGAWWGSDFHRAFYDVQELFTEARIPNADGQIDDQESISGRIKIAPSFPDSSTYDRYTYYRLISQLGTESIPDTESRSFRLAIQDNAPRLQEVRTNKIHLNYDNHFDLQNNQQHHQTNFVDWEPRELFMRSAQRLLMANITTNPPSFNVRNEQGQQFTVPGANFHRVGDTYVNRNFSVTNIQVWPEIVPGVNEYTANVHQLLQLAVNMTDPVTQVTDERPLAQFAGGNMDKFPLVFRPRFAVREDGSVSIDNFIEVTNDAPAQMRRPYRDLRFQAHRDILDPDDNVIGVPWVIAAKKGLPNFNEYGVLTTLELTRKLEINKTAPNAPMNLWQTNQMVVLSISNMCGLEAWNSYTNAYPRPVQLRAQVQCSMLVTNQLGRILATNWFAPNETRLLPANEWSGNDFVIPIQDTAIPVPKSIYDYATGRLIPTTLVPDNLFPDRNIFPTPQIGLAMTNRVQFYMLDEQTSRVLDYVNLDNLVTRLDVTEELLGAYGSGQSSPVSNYGGSGDSRMFWVTNRLGNANVITAPTEGVINQIFTSLDEIPVSQQLWNSFRARGTGRDREESIDLFRTFIGFPPKFLSAQQLALAYSRLNDPRKSFIRQVPFTPSLKKVIYNTWQANDPLVHYTVEDLTDLEGRAVRRELVDPPDRALDGRIHNIDKVNTRYRPWPSGNGADVSEYNVAVKDPLIRSSDDWQFPTNRFPNIGWLGRLHRGTPWQTVYLKSAIGTDGAGRILNVTDLPQTSSPIGEGYPFQTLQGDLTVGFNDETDLVDGSRANIMAIAQRNWFNWSGSMGTHPTNDWKLLEQFTTALDDNAARGLLSVNQPGLAAWSAVLSGVIVQTNLTTPEVLNRDLDGVQQAQFRVRTVDPAGVQALPENQNKPSQMLEMVNGPAGINGVRQFFRNGRFQHLGEVLSAPALTLQSPYLDWEDPVQYQTGIDDFAYERIPQQILSLLKADEPRVTVYAFGQSLRPADQSLRTDPEPPRLFNICTNYQVTGEYLFRRVVRFDGSITNLQATVESETVLPFD